MFAEIYRSQSVLLRTPLWPPPHSALGSGKQGSCTPKEMDKCAVEQRTHGLKVATGRAQSLLDPEDIWRVTEEREMLALLLG